MIADACSRDTRLQVAEESVANGQGVTVSPRSSPRVNRIMPEQAVVLTGMVRREGRRTTDINSSAPEKSLP